MEIIIPRTKVIMEKEEKQAALKVLNSGILVKGPEARNLGHEFSSYCGVKYGIPVNSGASALFIGLQVAGIEPGDEVITVPNTFVATANVIVYSRAKPVFVDIDPRTYNMDVDQLTKAITHRTKMILPVHLYGLPANMNPIMEIAEQHDLFVLEDCCQAHGAMYNGKKTGSFGHAAAFSFFPTKNVTVGGDGGILITNDSQLADDTLAIQNHGRYKGVEGAALGLNFRLSEVLAAIGRVQLKKLDQSIANRRQIADKYRKELIDVQEIELPCEPQNTFHVYHLYVPKFQRRDAIQHFLASHGIGTSIKYPKLISEMPPYIDRFGFKKGMFPVAESCVNRILAIPMFSQLTNDEIDYVCHNIRMFYEQNKT
ncbi:MAG: DegT/DnrJ/EryC1/StrS family aminotransferase [Candidatus Hodarchaeota archaeon]